MNPLALIAALAAGALVLLAGERGEKKESAPPPKPKTFEDGVKEGRAAAETEAKAARAQERRLEKVIRKNIALDRGVRSRRFFRDDDDDDGDTPPQGKETT